MGRSGNPARRAAETNPLAKRTHRLMNQTMVLVADLQKTDMHHDVLTHAMAAACGLMAVYSHQTGQPPPWDVIKQGNP